MEQVTLIQGDTGQGYTKVAVSRLDLQELETERYTRAPGPGIIYHDSEQQQITRRKRRRLRKEGVEGGEMFQDWGSRKLLVLAIVQKVNENSYNLETILGAIKIDQLKFRVTGDFSFFMPCLGLLKGCGSGNPCPLCDQERSKCGGGAAKWVEGADVNLRSFGSLMYNYAGWVLEGEHSQAIKTKRWKSVTGPVLIMGVDDMPETFILDKLIPGPLHLYLSLNEVLNYCEKNCWPELKAVLQTVSGAKVHVYMGKIGNYEGPNIRKIFQKLDTLKRYMTN